MAVVRCIADTTLDHLPPGATLVEAVVEVGSLEHLEPSVMDAAWNALAAEPPRDSRALAGSRLILEAVPVRIHCALCDLEHTPDEAAYLVCPRCGATRPRVLSGWGVTLTRLVVEIPDGTELDLDPVHAHATHTSAHPSSVES